MSSRLGKTTVVYFFTQVGTTLVGFLATWYITQTLGAGAFGEYSTAVAFLFWLNIPASAIGAAVKKRTSEGSERGAFLAAGHLLNIGVHALLVAGLLFFRDQVNVFVGLDVAIPFAVLVAARAGFDLTLSSLRGYKQVGTSGGLKTLERTLRSGIHIGALFFLGVGVSGLVLGHGAALLLATAAGLVVLEGRPSRPDWRHVSSLVQYARYAWLGTLKTRAFAWTDVMVMRGLSLSIIGLATVSKSQIGIYKVSWAIASALALLSISINHSLFPEFSELGAFEEYQQVHHYLNEGLAFVGLFLIPGLVGAIAVGDTILTVFGPEFAAGGTILVILMGSRLVAAYADQLLNTINAIDRPDIAFRVNLAYVAANVGLNLVLVSLFGWYGAAVATTIAAVVSVVLAGYALSSIIGRPDVPVGDFARQVTASVVMLAFVLGLQELLPTTLQWTLVIIAIGAGVYGVVLLVISERFRRKTFGILPR